MEFCRAQLHENECAQSGETSPSLHSSGVLELSLPHCAAGGPQLKRRFEISSLGSPSPMSRDGKASLSVSLDEQTDYLSPCSLSCRSWGAAESLQQILRSMTPDEVERRCAEDLAAAAAATSSPYAAISQSIELWRSFSCAGDEAAPVVCEDIKSSSSPHVEQHYQRRGPIARLEKRHRTVYKQEVTLPLYAVYHQCVPPLVGDIRNAELQQVPHTKRDAMCMQQRRVHGFYTYGIQTPVWAVPVCHPSKQTRNLQQYSQDLLHHSPHRLFVSQHQLQHRLEHHVGQFCQSCLVSRAAAQPPSSAAIPAAALVDLRAKTYSAQAFGSTNLFPGEDKVELVFVKAKEHRTSEHLVTNAVALEEIELV
ncbi:hypothetical protein Esti_001152 [Eimeria stiedai]